MSDYTLPIECRTPQQVMADIAYLDAEFRKPLAIVAAADKVCRRIERDKGRQWYFGLFWGSVAALVAFVGVWIWMQP